jgi:3',5'-nucleoside bisphosphate phosphatase
MKLYYDLHIHSALSPCADDSMRPKDIASMAKIKGLGVISIIDHVCGKNLLVSSNAAKEKGLLFLPGVEVTSANGIHLLCYFKDIDKAIEFSDMMYKTLPEKKIDIEYYGNQLIIDERDEVKEKLDNSLFQNTRFSVWDIIGLVYEYSGVVVPAHIDREYNGILAIEGDKIKEYNFNVVEVRKNMPMNYGIIKGSKVLYNSDAHILSRISEAENFIEINEKSIDAVFDYLTK